VTNKIILNVASCPACKDHHYDMEIVCLTRNEWISDGRNSIEYTHYYICQNNRSPEVVYVTVGVTNKTTK